MILDKLSQYPRPTAYGRATWWTGKVYCGLCERRYTMSKSHGCCCNANDQRLRNPCSAPSMGYKELERCVKSIVRFTLLHPESIIDQTRKYYTELEKEKKLLISELAEKEKKVVDYHLEKQRLRWQHQKGYINDTKLSEEIAEVDKEAERFAARVSELKLLLQRSDCPTPDELNEVIEELRHNFQRPSEPRHFLEGWESVQVVTTAMLGHCDYATIEDAYGPISGPTSDQTWEWLADRLNLRIIIYPPRHEDVNNKRSKADIRVIGDFNPAAVARKSIG
ncbi:hypothetical protein ACFLVX_04595, partial [Chloroflexota bacterium]